MPSRGSKDYRAVHPRLDGMGCIEKRKLLSASEVLLFPSFFFPFAMLLSILRQCKVAMLEERGWVCQDVRRCYRMVTFVLPGLAHLLAVVVYIYSAGGFA